MPAWIYKSSRLFLTMQTKKFRRKLQQIIISWDQLNSHMTNISLCYYKREFHLTVYFFVHFFIQLADPFLTTEYVLLPTIINMMNNKTVSSCPLLYLSYFFYLPAVTNRVYRRVQVKESFCRYPNDARTHFNPSIYHDCYGRNNMRNTADNQRQQHPCYDRNCFLVSYNVSAIPPPLVCPW